MYLETIYYIGQSIAVIAIIGSLLFVGVQLRQSRLIERAAAQRDLLARVSELIVRISNTEEDIDGFVHGLNDFEKSNALIQFRFSASASEMVFIAESALNMYRDGFFSEGTWTGIEGAALALIRTPGGSQWWSDAKHYIGPEIVEHLEMRLREIDPSAPTLMDFGPHYRKRLVEMGLS